MENYVDFIDDLKELKALYNTGDLRNFDFERMIQKYEFKCEQFDSAMDRFFKDHYKPEFEV